jgi:thiol-disulfide isomerase/thioredoxin
MTLSRAVRGLLHLALAAPLVLVVLLVRQHRDLTRLHRELRIRLVTLSAGDVVPLFRAPAFGGDTLTIGKGSPGAHQVLMVLTKECPFCRATLPVWREIAERVTTSAPVRATVIAVALDSIERMPAYLASYGLRLPVVAFPDRRTRKLFRAGVVPQTVVLSDSGTVLYAHTGLIANRTVEDSVIAAALSPSAKTREVTRSKP